MAKSGRAAPSKSEARSIALRSLVFLAADDDAYGAFSGAHRRQIPAIFARSSATKGFQIALLEHVCGDEPLLIAFAAEENLSTRERRRGVHRAIGAHHGLRRESGAKAQRAESSPFFVMIARRPGSPRPLWRRCRPERIARRKRRSPRRSRRDRRAAAPPSTAVIPGRLSMATRPPATISSSALVGRLNRAAVRALCVAISAEAGCVPSSRCKSTRWPPSSTMAMTTFQPFPIASASAAAATRRASARVRANLCLHRPSVLSFATAASGGLARRRPLE